MNIRTNYHWRDLVDAHEVPAEVLLDQFDYNIPDETMERIRSIAGDQLRGAYYGDVDADRMEAIYTAIRAADVEGSYFVYGRWWYALDQFMRDSPDGWDGFCAEGFSSGVTIRIDNRGERVQVGWAHA